jgi:GT2 family glycosyltransferase
VAKPIMVPVGRNGRRMELYCGRLRPVPFLFLGAIHRRDWEALGGYDENLPARNDEDFANRLKARGVRFHFVAKAVAVHLKHGKS